MLFSTLMKHNLIIWKKGELKQQNGNLVIQTESVLLFASPFVSAQSEPFRTGTHESVRQIDTQVRADHSWEEGALVFIPDAGAITQISGVVVLVRIVSFVACLWGVDRVIGLYDYVHNTETESHSMHIIDWLLNFLRHDYYKDNLLITDLTTLGYN